MSTQDAAASAKGRTAQEQPGARRRAVPRPCMACASGVRPGTPPPRQCPRRLMLVGLPGSGKSTFAAALPGAIVVSQDDAQGSRRACEAAVGRVCLHAGGTHGVVVLDRCNVDPGDRAAWVALSGAPSASWTVVFLECSPEDCAARVDARADHPTVRQGRGRCVVRSHAAKLVAPSLSEGFAAVHTIRSPDEAKALLVRFGVAAARVEAAYRGVFVGIGRMDAFVKFPRTSHILDAATWEAADAEGRTAVTRDDLLLTAADAVRLFLDGTTVVTVEEKVGSRVVSGVRP